MSTLRKIEDVQQHEGHVVKHFWKLVALGVLLSLAVPAQGLGSSEFKGTSILIIMEAEYWQVSLIIGTLYTIFITIFHFGWKLQDYLYLKELNEKKERLMRELGLMVVDDQTNPFADTVVTDLNPDKMALHSSPSLPVASKE